MFLYNNLLIKKEIKYSSIYANIAEKKLKFKSVCMCVFDTRVYVKKLYSEEIYSHAGGKSHAGVTSTEFEKRKKTGSISCL